MRILGADSFTGTTTSIDAIPKSYLRNGDLCMVKAVDKLFWYQYKIGSNLPHSIPHVIIPQDNIDPSVDDGGRWILFDIFVSHIYADTIQATNIIPSASDTHLNINNTLYVSTSGAMINGPLEIITDNVPPSIEAPFIINSDKMVENLNSDLLDGYNADDFVQKEYGISSIPYPSPSGSASPSAGPRWMYLSFSKPAKNTNYSVFTTITNTIDPDPSIYATTITEKTTAGFKVSYSGEIDSPNYKLEYLAVGDFE